MTKSMSSVRGREVVSILHHLNALLATHTPSTHLRHDGDEQPSSSDVVGAVESGLHAVLGQPAVHTLAAGHLHSEGFMAVSRAFSQRLEESVPKDVSDKGKDDFLDVSQGQFPHREVGQVESGHPKLVNESERNQPEAQENEEVLIEKDNPYSIFATVAPMPPRQARRSMSK